MNFNLKEKTLKNPTQKNCDTNTITLQKESEIYNLKPTYNSKSISRKKNINMPPKRDSSAAANHNGNSSTNSNNETTATSSTNSSNPTAAANLQSNNTTSSTNGSNTTTTAAAAAAGGSAGNNNMLPVYMADAAAEQRTIAYQANAKLCRLVRKCPWMYDRNHHNYAKKHILDKSWCKIAKECNDSGEFNTERKR